MRTVEVRLRRTSAARLMLVLCAGLLVTAGCASAPEGGGGAARHQDSASQGPDPVSLTLTPGRDATDVEPGEPVTVAAEGGTLTEVTLVGKDGTVVDGQLADDSASWETTQELGFGKTYTLTATGENPAGKQRTVKSTFTTATPADKVGVTVNFSDGQTVGVGMPLIFDFTRAVPDREAMEQALQISADPDTTGSFHWFRDDYAVWRPKEHWQPGTTITVDAEVYGQEFGDGVYGQQDESYELTVGDEVIATVDGETHTMKVRVNGSVAKTYEISMGGPQHPTPHGTYTVMGDRTNYLMTSESFGVPADSPGGYKVRVDYATRLSIQGIFFHSAPWSVAAQGERNVSHGCINMRTSQARWLMNHTKPGDLVKVVNSGGRRLEPANGWSFWQMPWDEWTTET